MIFRRSTRSIVTGRRNKAPSDVTGSSEDGLDILNTPPSPPEDESNTGVFTASLLRWAIPVGIAALAIILFIVLLIPKPDSNEPPTEPDIPPVTMPGLDADQNIISVQSDTGLAALVAPGDVVQLYGTGGSDLPALRYVEVYQSTEDGRLLLIVDDTQAAAIISGELSDRVLLISHNDPQQAEDLLDLQARINDPEIKLTLQSTVQAAPRDTIQLEFVAEIQPAEAPFPEIVWESDNPDVAAVKKGIVYAQGVGSAIITARCGNAEATCSVTIEIPLEEIQLDRQSAAIAVGESLQLVATPVPEDATRFPVVWHSEDPAIATVAEDGTVTGVAPGKVLITATSGEFSIQCSITVGYHAEVVQLDQQSIALTVGQTYTLTPTVYPSADMIDVFKFESSNAKIAKVSSDGTVTAVAAGKAYITLRCGEATVKCLVTVTAPEPQP